jgi:tetratricopeptide (TPR) repeat protein
VPSGSEEEAYRLALATPPPRAAPPAAPAPAKGAAGPPPAAAQPAPRAPERAATPAPAPGERAPESAVRSSRSAPVQISARSAADPTYLRLERAYGAFQAGQYEEARRLYREVLARDPRNRDALLGMGAVAVALGESSQAEAAYGRVLVQNPQDRVAAAAMTGLGSGAAPASQGESRLRQLLQQDPGAPYLHFSLGNLYASQRRWPEAQQAYFDAYRADSSNPDYAFNLAVSLDRLGKRRPALEYYQRALDLAERRAAAFSAAAVRERIQRIEAAEGGGAS